MANITYGKLVSNENDFGLCGLTYPNYPSYYKGIDEDGLHVFVIRCLIKPATYTAMNPTSWNCSINFGSLAYRLASLTKIGTQGSFDVYELTIHAATPDRGRNNNVLPYVCTVLYATSGMDGKLMFRLFVPANPSGEETSLVTGGGFLDGAWTGSPQELINTPTHMTARKGDSSVTQDNVPLTVHTWQIAPCNVKGSSGRADYSINDTYDRRYGSAVSVIPTATGYRSETTYYGYFCEFDGEIDMPSGWSDWAAGKGIDRDTIDVSGFGVGVARISAEQKTKITIRFPNLTSQLTKTYDGTDAAHIDFEVSGIKQEDTSNVTVGCVSRFATSKATDNTYIIHNITISGSAADKYELPIIQNTLGGQIQKKQLTVSETSVTNKVWDGTTVANINIGQISGLIQNDDVWVVATGTYPSANTGTYSMTVNYILKGSDGANYVKPASHTVSASITNKTITISCIGISYDEEQ